jgi:hypothetical protein
VAISACGGGPAASDDASAPSSADVTPTPTPTAIPTPTPTSTPGTPGPVSLEGRPQVRVLRSWASAIGQDINAGDQSMPRAARFETSHGQEVIPRYAAEDLGLHYPGPAPFTPVSVTAADGRATVSVCWMSKGWAQNSATFEPVDKRTIDPAAMTMRKVGGTWLLDDIRYGDADCTGVAVKGVRW